ncbi:MAG: carboxypeptidase regulatory-like domain-containing protein, partial [bacterium]
LEYEIIDPATDTHILHGLIVDRDTDDPIAGIAVQVFSYLGSPIPGLVDTTGPGGGYEFEVYPGTYAIGAFDPDLDYHPVFYHDRHDLLFADPIIVDSTSPSLIVLDTLHMEPIPGGGALYSVSGIITEAGAGPIDAAYVVAISSEDDEIQDAAITNPMGEYVLDLPNGEFIILAFHESYIPGFYGGGMFWVSAETIVVAGAPIGGLDIELIPAMPGGGDFRLFGFVFSDSSARAVTTVAERGVRVYLIDAVTEQVVSATVSDNTGYYEFQNLDAGTYSLIPDLVGYEPTAGGWDVIVSGSTEVNMTLVEYTNIPGKDLRAYDFELDGIAPNPFNSACAISYSIDRPGDVAIEVFDVNGRMVESIENRRLTTGDYITVWNPEDISSGVYLVRISLDGEGYSRKVLLLK